MHPKPYHRRSNRMLTATSTCNPLKKDSALLWWCIRPQHQKVNINLEMLYDKYLKALLLCTLCKTFAFPFQFVLAGIFPLRTETRNFKFEYNDGVYKARRKKTENGNQIEGKSFNDIVIRFMLVRFIILFRKL